VKNWPVSTVVLLEVSVAVRAAGACTVIAAASTVPVERTRPLFASVPLAEVLRVSVPAVAVEQPE
jgi:hypothetical protein